MLRLVAAGRSNKVIAH
ncbi:hypothetical protein [Mesorhizobium sp. M1216]